MSAGGAAAVDDIGTQTDDGRKAVSALVEQLRAQVADAQALCERWFNGDAGAEKTLADSLAQIEQVARVTRLDGIALLAAECRAVAAGAGKEDDTARRQAVAEGLIALGLRLVQLKAGDNTAALGSLADLNMLRTARGATPLDGPALFAELLRARAPFAVPVTAPETTKGQQAVAQRVLEPAGKIFTVMSRGADAASALDSLRKLAASMERAAADADQVQPWWVARTLIEAIQAGAVPLDSGARTALSALQSLLGAAAKGKPAAAVGWTYRALYLAGRAGRATPGLEQLFDCYGLDELIGETAAEPEPDRSAARQAREAVSGAAREELARVRDAFDVFLRSGAADTDLLKPAVARLDAIIAPLGFAGIDDAAELLAGVRTSLAALVEGQPLGNTAYSIADELLRAEESLATGTTGPGDKMRREAMRALVDTVQAVLERVRQALFEAAEVDDLTALGEVPATLVQLAGVLEVSGLDEAGALVSDVAGALAVAADGGAPLDALAEALVSLDLYMGALRDGDLAPPQLLVRAQAALGIAVPAEARAARADADAEPPVVSGEADPDLLAVYVEEALEYTVEARAQYIAWREQPDDAAARAELQRLFHTLKGSGRMVGALRLAEFAHSFEDLTARMADDPAGTGMQVIELVGAAVAVLPALVEQLESGRDPGVDLRELQRAAAAPDLAQVEPGSGRSVLAVTAERELAVVRRWLEALAAGKSSGLVPAAASDALQALAFAAETLGSLQAAGKAQALRERLLDAAEIDEAMQREITVALDELAEDAGPRVSEGNIDRASADAFRDEARGLLDLIADACDALLLDAADADAVLAMQRELHTLKGASRVSGLRALSDVAHMLEAVLRAVAQEQMTVTPRLLWTLQRVFDAMHGMLEPDTADRAGEKAGLVMDELRQLSSDDRSLPPLSSGADRRRRPRVAAESERVRSDQFDRALVRALSLGLRSTELDRRMHEQTMWSIESIGGMLKELADDAAAIRDLLVRARVAPLHAHASRWRRTVRQAAEDAGREVELRFEGSDVELDRRLLDALVTPVEHLLRNAVVHGIESPFARRAAGKAACGTLFIRSMLDADGLTVEVDDDGAGIDPEKVRRIARDHGMEVPEGQIDSRKLLELLATPGLSTAPEVTHAAGYGMGVDTVVTAVRELGGRMELDTQPGRTRFILHLPNPSPVLSVELVRVGGALVALPPAAVVAMRVGAQGIDGIEHEGETWPLVEVAPLLGLESARAAADATTCVLLRSRGRGLAIRVDESLGQCETAMHRLRPGDLREGVFVAGVGLLDGGRLASVLNVDAAVAAAPEALTIRPYAFVADDSATARDEVVRKLGRLGWRVNAVEDGALAKQKLSRERPQLVVLDIDMPGYDGLEVVEWMRKQPPLAATPVILVSAAFDDARRERAGGFAVSACVDKPFKGVEFEDAVAALK